MMPRKVVLRGLALALAGMACVDLTGPEVHPGLLPLFRTESAQYELRKVRDGREVTIDVEFTNHTKQTVYFVNCLGDTRPRLQKQVGDAWVTVWAPITFSCLSQPVTVVPGGTYQSEVRIFGADANTNIVPKFAGTDLNGTFRLGWSGLVHDYHDGPPFGEPLPVDYRVSNTFTLTSPP